MSSERSSPTAPELIGVTASAAVEAIAVLAGVAAGSPQLGGSSAQSRLVAAAARVVGSP